MCNLHIHPHTSVPLDGPKFIPFIKPLSDKLVILRISASLN